MRGLLAGGADPNIRDRNGVFVLMLAATSVDIALARALLAAGAGATGARRSGRPSHWRRRAAMDGAEINSYLLILGGARTRVKRQQFSFWLFRVISSYARAVVSDQQF